MANDGNKPASRGLRSLLLNQVVEPLHGLWGRFKAECLGLGQRDWTKEDAATLRAHWVQRYHERNFFVRDRVAHFAPTSILEVGSGCGNILFLLGQSLPGSRITGIEINPLAVILGNTWLREEGVTNVQLKEGRAEQLDTIPDKSFDVVFSCASLMYVMPAHIEQVLLNMARITRRTVILIEMHGDLSLKYLGEFHLPNNWKRNYRRIFENLGISDDRIHIEPVPSHLWQPGGGGASYIEVRIA